MKLSDNNIKQLDSLGKSVSQIEKQINLFKKGTPFIELIRPAVLHDGLLNLDAKKEHYISFFENQKDTLNLVKFVPASGAATRMFKSLFAFLNNYSHEDGLVDKKQGPSLITFFNNLKQFSFHQEVVEKAKLLYSEYDNSSSSKQKYYFVKALLDENGMNYGAIPKGLLPFHNYNIHCATAFLEHLYEAALYAKSNKTASVHFTISKNHLSKFQNEFYNVQHFVEKKTNTAFDVSFSFQKTETDTIAVDENNDPFLEKNALFFRPGGHGALIENLNTIDADIVFIKNIDNVVTSKYQPDIADYKKLLAGKLLEIQTQSFTYLKQLEKGLINDLYLKNIENFLSKELHITLNSEYKTASEEKKIKACISKLNRPIRVCGMVKNEGEPGGGPFWVKETNGSISLQIIESAQVNMKEENQVKIIQRATHFNPVDLVCGLKNYKGKSFDLIDYVDHDAVFISEKTKNGRILKALELPGLWNGAMAYWNTIFVEVPLITFNPVKTVNDLLKDAHQV